MKTTAMIHSEYKINICKGVWLGSWDHLEVPGQLFNNFVLLQIL